MFFPGMRQKQTIPDKGSVALAAAIPFADFLSTRLPFCAGRPQAAGRVQSARKKAGLPLFIRGRPALFAHRVKSRLSVKSRKPNPSPTGKIKFGFLSLGTVAVKAARKRLSSSVSGVYVQRMEDITEALWDSKASLSTISELNKKVYNHSDDGWNRPL